jgi:hypothetical protein
MFERANLGLRGAELMGNLGGQQAQLATQRRGLAAADIDAMQKIGLQQQQQKQSSLDLAYQDFINQRDYGDNRLDGYAASRMQEYQGVSSPRQPNRNIKRYNSEHKWYKYRTHAAGVHQ